MVKVFIDTRSWECACSEEGYYDLRDLPGHIELTAQSAWEGNHFMASLLPDTLGLTLYTAYASTMSHNEQDAVLAEASTSGMEYPWFVFTYLGDIYAHHRKGLYARELANLLKNRSYIEEFSNRICSMHTGFHDGWPHWSVSLIGVGTRAGMPDGYLTVDECSRLPLVGALRKLERWLEGDCGGQEVSIEER